MSRPSAPGAAPRLLLSPLRAALAALALGAAGWGLCAAAGERTPTGDWGRSAGLVGAALVAGRLLRATALRRAGGRPAALRPLSVGAAPVAIRAVRRALLLALLPPVAAAVAVGPWSGGPALAFAAALALCGPDLVLLLALRDADPAQRVADLLDLPGLRLLPGP